MEEIMNAQNIAPEEIEEEVVTTEEEYDVNTEEGDDGATIISCVTIVKSK